MGKWDSNAREKSSPTKPGYILCCPFCDEWRLSDSHAARRKLGLHLANRHADEVLFPPGVEPPELETFEQ